MLFRRHVFLDNMEISYFSELEYGQPNRSKRSSHSAQNTTSVWWGKKKVGQKDEKGYTEFNDKDIFGKRRGGNHMNHARRLTYRFLVVG